MKPLKLLFFSLCGWSFIFLLFFGAYFRDSNWATVAITGILVIITAYYAIATENILKVNAHYAQTTDEILKTNQRTLELLIIQKRSAKIEEIAKTIILPLDKEVKILMERIKDKSNVIVINPSLNGYTFQRFKEIPVQVQLLK